MENSGNPWRTPTGRVSRHCLASALPRALRNDAEQMTVLALGSEPVSVLHVHHVRSVVFARRGTECDWIVPVEAIPIPGVAPGGRMHRP